MTGEDDPIRAYRLGEEIGRRFGFRVIGPPLWEMPVHGTVVGP